MKYNLVVCGGTFDHLHKGHESLLKLALSLGNKVIIGLTSDKYIEKTKIRNPHFAKALKDKQNSEIESFEVRKNGVLEFLKEKNIDNKTEIVKIENLFGPTLSRDLKIDAIVVSEDTEKGAQFINLKRKELGLAPLKIIVTLCLKAMDGKIISSKRIRNGEINTKGKLYVKKLWFSKDLILSKNLRSELKKPFGKLVREIDINPRATCIITVGDATTKKFNEHALCQNISVVDFKIARQKKFSSFAELGFFGDEKIIEVNNPAGHITSDLFSKISNIFKSELEKERIILKVTGEEDLAVLPLVLLSPLNTIIYYGQPNMGLVKIVVSESAKDKAYNFVSKLKPI